MNTKDLCRFLRYRRDILTTLAADKIERQQEFLELAWDAICEAGYEDHSWKLKNMMDEEEVS